MKTKLTLFLILLAATINSFSQSHSTFNTFSLQTERGNSFNYYINPEQTNLFADAGFSKSFGKNNRLQFDYAAQLNLFHNRYYPYYYLDLYMLPYPDFQSYSEINLNIPLALTYYYDSPVKHKFCFGTKLELGLSNTILNITRTHYYNYPEEGKFSNVVNFLYNDGHFGTTPSINAFLGFPFRINFDKKEYVELTPKINIASVFPGRVYDMSYSTFPTFATQITYAFLHHKRVPVTKTITPSF